MKFIYSSLLLAIFISPAFAGEEQPPIKGAQKVIMSTERKSVAFVSLYDDQQIAVADQLDWLRFNVLNAKMSDGFSIYQTDKDQIGYIHYRYKQSYNTIPVEYGVYYLHTKNGKVVSANGEFYPGINVPTSPSVSKATAFQSALANFPSLKYSWQKENTNADATIQAAAIVVLPFKGHYYLAYKFDILSYDPMDRANVYVDAVTGKFITKNKTMYSSDANGTAITFYSGTRAIKTDSLSPSNFRLHENGRGGGITTWNTTNGNYFYDTDNTWNNVNAQLDQFAGDCHWIAEMTYDFYFQNFGRSSFDNASAPMQMLCHDGMYVNAFWNAGTVQFGDGDGTQYYPLVSPEIVGHEFTHGVTEYSAALVYSGESGALNESFSDVMGNTIRFLYTPTNATWFVGDQIVIPSMGGQPFRNMSNPNQFQCADTYGGLWFNNGDVVHYDSGIQNFWYYLLCQGGTGTNDIGNNYAVTGIGMTDAVKIAYRNLTTYLTANATFLDARNFADQSAIDLFGSCSQQEIQTVNAWYAVGVGGVFSGSVLANFSGSPTVACSSPATVNFFNSSSNATTFSWTFGDGGNSTASNPSHTYLTSGNYNVTLYAYGSGSCNGSDTLLRTNYINVGNTVGPVPASCIPLTSTYCCGEGITNVTFKNINHNSGTAIDNYQDYSCADSTYLIAGDPYNLSVTTGTNFSENVKAWIDYNNDGIFNNTNELVFTHSGLLTHSGIVHTPTTATLNVPLRMRVMSDDIANAIVNSCTNPVKGQAEDYMVTFKANTLAPDVNFTANMFTIPVGGAINFYDLTQHAPTLWNWTFTSGTPSTSTIQNPTNIVYNTAGVYPVKLKATNSFGNDSLTQVAYINVVNVATACTNTSSLAQSGIIYDSGGPNGNYADNENCDFLITSVCAQQITLAFDTINIEATWDFIYVYDGTNTSGPLLYTASGFFTNIPPIVATSGNMFIHFTSDVSVNFSGFKATWNISQCLGMNEYGSAGSVNLYPNPFGDQSTLVITDATGFNKANVEIYDVLGKNIRSIVSEINEKRTEVPIERSGISSGIYFYKVFGENSEGARTVIGTGKMVIE